MGRRDSFNHHSAHDSITRDFGFIIPSITFNLIEEVSTEAAQHPLILPEVSVPEGR